jgi:hypothetical protein
MRRRGEEKMKWKGMRENIKKDRRKRNRKWRKKRKR